MQSLCIRIDFALQKILYDNGFGFLLGIFFPKGLQQWKTLITFAVLSRTLYKERSLTSFLASKKTTLSPTSLCKRFVTTK